MFGKLFKQEEERQNFRTESVPILYYNSNQAAFEMACKYYCGGRIKKGTPLPALVLDASKEYGTGNAVRKDEDGYQIAVLQIATNDGGFRVLAKTSGKNGPDLKPGDFVAWMPMVNNKEFRISEDKRSGWVGVIAATIQAAYDSNTQAWLIDKKFE